MLTNCNAFGAIVTCGGVGFLLGAIVAAILLGRGHVLRDERDAVDRRRRATTLEWCRGRLALALDDLHGIATPEDVRLARNGINAAAERLEALEFEARVEVEA